jgi:hypothetical protein
VIFFTAFINMGYVRIDFTRRMPVAPDLATHKTEEIAGDHGKHSMNRARTLCSR